MDWWTTDLTPEEILSLLEQGQTLNLKPLSLEIKKGGQYPYTLTQLKRIGRYAIYQRRELSGILSWEVIKVVEKPKGQKLNGRYYPPHETYPGASQWGIMGWTDLSLKAAEERFERLCEKKANKE